MEPEIQQGLKRMSLGEMPFREIQRESNVMGLTSDADLAKVAALMKKAKSAVEEGHPRAALEILQKAAKIQSTEKILKRIAKLEAYLAENGSEDEEEEDDNMVHVGKGFYVFKDLYNKLYEYQKESLLWFWRLHRKQKGGILGDDMGLGKTVQVVAFLSGLFDMEQVNNVLIVLPVALLINWEREFKKWAPGIGVHTFHGASKKERERLLERVQRRGGVLMVSYGLVVTCWEQINHHHGNDFIWDYVILDEGHKIKNPTKTTKAVNAITAKHRFILTGTPIQNSLKEFWSLFNFVTHGTLLGTLQTFKSEYDNPITRAREKDATASEKLLGNEMAESLRLLIAPYFMRRTKADVLENKKEDSAQDDSEASGSTRDGRSPSPENSVPSLTRKNDLIVWLSLTETQVQIYKDFISLDRVKELLMTKRSPLAELTILKKLCDHPRLLSNRACRQLGLQMSEEGYDENDDPSEMECAANSTQAISDETLFLESGKLQFLVTLLTNLRNEDHRCLVFSQSRKMLDIVEKILKARRFKLMRLDGTITKMSDREDRISRFQRDHSYSVFLLTTQVGGVGLTLTGADRVVIIDPSWNPATDNQAVDRAYRIGQTRAVVIYRLITCGTVEEKIYRRQIFKESLTKQTTGGSKNPYRYFTGQQLKELFVLDDPKISQTQMQLEAMHSAHRKTDIELDAHIAFLYSTDIFGISDHDLMFSQEAHAEPNHEFEEEGNQYIQQRRQRAQDLVAQESDLTRKLNDHITRGTEGPGGAKKRYSMNVNRDRLQSEWAEKTGEGVINPPLQNIPRHYKPEDRPPPRGANIVVEDLDRTMEELTLDESRISVDAEEEDFAQCSPGFQSAGSEGSKEDDEEVVIIDESPPGSGAEEDGGSQPVSVFVIDDDSRPGSRNEDNSRPGSRIEDKAFIGESYLPEDGSRGYYDDSGSRNTTSNDDRVARSKLDQDEDMEDYIDDRSDSSQSDPQGLRNQEGSEKSGDDSLELVVGMSPLPKRQSGSFQDLDTNGESCRDMNDFDTGATNDTNDSGSWRRSRGEESKHVMPSDTDSYGMMDVGSGQPSDLPYFNATRQLSLEESRSLASSCQASRDEEAESKVNTIEWENGECSSQGMRPVSGERMRDQDVSMSAADNDDVELDSEDDDGSYGEVVEVSISSFCCQANGDVSQDMDVSIPAGTSNPERQNQSMPVSEDESISVHDGDGKSLETGSPHSDRQEDGVEDEESYEDVSMASFSVQTDDVDDQTNVQSANPEYHQDKPDSSYDSNVEDCPPHREGRCSSTASDPKEGPPPGGIDLDATSRFLGLTSEESPFLGTSSPVAKARHIRRIVSDDENEDEEEESVFERDVSPGSRGGFPNSEGKLRRSGGSMDEETGRRERQCISKRKKPSSVLVDDSDDDDEEDVRRSSKTTKSSLDDEQSAVLEDSMGDFIVGDSDEEQSFDEHSADKDAVIDDSIDASEESPAEEEGEKEEEEEEQVGRKRRKKHVIVSDDEDDDENEDDNDEEDDEDYMCSSKPDDGHIKSGMKSDFIATETAEGRSASYDTGGMSDDESEETAFKDNEEHSELEEEEGEEEEEDKDVEYSDENIVDEEEDGEEEEEEEEEESDENRSEDEVDDEIREEYKALVKKGMSRISEGDNKGALRSFLRALYIDGSSEQLQLIALKLKKKLENQ